MGSIFGYLHPCGLEYLSGTFGSAYDFLKEDLTGCSRTLPYIPSIRGVYSVQSVQSVQIVQSVQSFQSVQSVQNETFT